jgi:NAD(P)-dependent dehydrogenase (short-subunit alcohol dehydrogenase family)
MDLSVLSLEGRVAIVTGAGGIRGIGRGIALSLAKAGAAVAVTDLIMKEKNWDLEGTAEEIRKLGQRSLAVQADVTKESDVANLVKKVEKEFGTIDILANIAGVIVHVPFLEATREQWDKSMDVNLRSQFICGQEVSKVMIKHKKGNIINCISLSAYKIGQAYVYGIAKLGATALTGWEARELGPYNIRVNGIAPGNVMTDLGSHGIMLAPRPTQDPTPANLEEMIKRMIPLGRVQKPDDIGDVAVFLASDASRMITGQIIIVDGGIMVM